MLVSLPCPLSFNPSAFLPILFYRVPVAGDGRQNLTELEPTPAKLFEKKTEQAWAYVITAIRANTLVYILLHLKLPKQLTCSQLPSGGTHTLPAPLHAMTFHTTALLNMRITFLNGKSQILWIWNQASLSECKMFCSVLSYETSLLRPKHSITDPPHPVIRQGGQAHTEARREEVINQA